MVLTALWVIPVSDLAGVARHCLDVAAVGIPNVELHFLVPPGPLAERLAALPVKLIVAEFGPEFGIAKSGKNLRAAIAAIKPQLVHTHLGYADIIAAIFTPRKITLVSTEHGIATAGPNYQLSDGGLFLKQKLHRYRVQRFRAIIGVSQATCAAVVRRWQPKKHTLVSLGYNAVDPVTISPTVSQPGLKILSLSRLSSEKGIHNLLAGFAELLNSHPEAKLTIAGTGPQKVELLNLAAQLKITDSVEFVGFVPPESVLDSHQVLVQLSELVAGAPGENCSYTLLDAVNHGLGVVSTPLGGNKEILPGHCLIANPQDATELARMISVQGLQLHQRPKLDNWPDRAEMTNAISKLYQMF